MRYVAKTLVVCLIAFTALSMAFQPTLTDYVLVYVSTFPLRLFDLLLVASMAAFFFTIGLRPPTDPSSSNRTALRLVGAFLLYQLLIVMPVAAILHDVSPGNAYTVLAVRFALILIPFFYYVALRYVTPRRLITLVNAAAVLLLLYAIYRYVFIGPIGEYDYGEFRLRILWGGSTLLFGWVVVTGLFYERRGWLGYLMGVGGIVGIALVNHRSGYVALIFALAFQLLLVLRLSKRVLAVVLAVLIIGAMMAWASPTFRDSATYSLTTMFNAHADVTAQDRVQRTQLAWEYLKTQPLGDYVWTQRFYLVDLGSEGFEPHNFVIQALDKQGWVSACLLFATIGYILWIGWTRRRASRLAAAMTTYLVFYLVFCLFNTTFESPENVTLFTLAAALILCANRQLTTAAKETPAGVEAGPQPPDADGPAVGTDQGDSGASAPCAPAT